jgi:hypothetical protein
MKKITEFFGSLKLLSKICIVRYMSRQPDWSNGSVAAQISIDLIQKSTTAKVVVTFAHFRFSVFVFCVVAKQLKREFDLSTTSHFLIVATITKNHYT